MFDVNMVIGIGNSSAISTSKIMKVTAIKKNRDEKGPARQLSINLYDIYHC
jgi:alcohol dehydrogenase class IV